MACLIDMSVWLEDFMNKPRFKGDSEINFARGVHVCTGFSFVLFAKNIYFKLQIN